MIKALVGDVKTGRLRRLQYLGYSLLLSLLMLGFGFAIVTAFGAGEHIIGGDIQKAQDKLHEMFTLPFMIVFAVVSLFFLFAGANIMAKRIRDIGLPGWWLVLLIFSISVTVSYLISSEVSSGLNTLIWVLLLLVPGNVVGKGEQPVQ